MRIPVPLALSAVAFAFVCAGPLFARLGHGPKVGTLKITLFGVLLSIAGLAVAAVRLSQGTAPVWQGALALGLSLPGPLGVVLALWKGRGLPPINDVSTDLEDPPVFQHSTAIPENASRDMRFPEKNKELVRRAYGDLKTVEMPGNVDDVFDRARRTAMAMPGWLIAAADPTARTIEASEETSLFRFVDDVVVRVRAGTSGVRIDVRSKSREGRGDLGANAARIRAFLRRLTSPV